MTNIQEITYNTYLGLTMAQTEDTELRDLVIEALDKNGSLAKIRALLRANVFLAFEDECANIKHNPALDNVLQMPEGLLALSIVHEFLDFCNLKNTLFVYTAESRQGKDYRYEGNKLAERLNLPRSESRRNDPILVSLIKRLSKAFDLKLGPKHFDSHKGAGDKNLKDDQNCTYIVHEDTSGSATSNSHSDSSSDEKNKLHLRLNLDNSDTDTSSDSAREKSCSEYIPNEHLLTTDDNNILPPKTRNTISSNQQSVFLHGNEHVIHSPYLQELKLFNNSSTDSTSYAELKSFDKLDEKMINTSGVPCVDSESKNPFSMIMNTVTLQPLQNTQSDKLTKRSEREKDSTSSATLSMSLSRKHLDDSKSKWNKVMDQSEDTAEYSYDFTSPHTPPSTRNSLDPSQASESIQEVFIQSLIKSPESQHQNSQSPHSSISLSDVADLISENSYLEQSKVENLNGGNVSDRQANPNGDQQKPSDDFSESSVPSMSNLSLEIHSD